MKNFTKITGLLILTFMFFGINGKTQVYVPVTVTGFTEDVIANGVGAASSSITADVDGAGYALVAEDFDSNGSTPTNDHFLPNGGTIQNGTKLFQLADYSSNNSLRLPNNTSETLTFSTTQSLKAISILGVSGSGSSNVSGFITFVDNSTQTFNDLSYPDWYDNTGNIVATQVGRVNTTNNGLENGPQLHENFITIDESNQTKEIASINFSNIGGVMNILAVSELVMAPYCTPTSSSSLDYILSFTTTGGFTNISDVSGEPNNGYTDFYNSHSVSQYAGSNINFVETYHGGDHGFSIWVDFNENGVFEPGERLFNATSIATGYLGSITIPTNTPIGEYRMRVRGWWNQTNPDPCEEISYGEARDYKLIVIDGSPTINPSPGGINYTDLRTWFKADNYTSGATTWSNSKSNPNIPELNSISAPIFEVSNARWNYNPSLRFSRTQDDNFTTTFPNVNDILSPSQGTIIGVGTFEGTNTQEGGRDDVGFCGYYGNPGTSNGNDEFSFQSIGAWYRGQN